MDPKLISALVVGKSIRYLIRKRRGGATAAPGLYALKIDQKLVEKLNSTLRYGSIVVTGTNGKTTTSRLIAQILQEKYKLVHNRQGSNLHRGIASTMVSASSIFGKVDKELAVWELDEATFSTTVQRLKPKVVVLTNLFRDQLDRYGEVDAVKNRWLVALEKLSKSTVLIANADDPGIVFIAKKFKGKVIYFGVEEKTLDLSGINNVADVRYCPNCSSRLNYSLVFSSHLGHYSCSKCTFKRPSPSIFATKIKFNQDFSTSFSLTSNHQLTIINYQLPGLFNVYNVLAAVAVAQIFGSDLLKAAESTASFSAVFGRNQDVVYKGRKIKIFLIKNPTGANEVLRVLAPRKDLNILALLNDKLADGTDVSWIWDTHWEAIATSVENAFVGGTRSWDIANRFKYAGIVLEKNFVKENILDSINFTLDNMNSKDTLIILPTYTAMLEIQKVFQKTGGLKWHEE